MSARSTQKHKNSGESAGLTARLTAPQETAARARRQQATLIEGGDERPPSRSGRATESPLRRVFFKSMPDDPGVLGNLPRSRPGRRSDKRAAGKPSGGAKPKSGQPAAKPRASAARGKRAATAQRSQRPAPRPQPKGAGGGDPVTGAIRLAGQAASLPFKVAGEVIKRLPRG